jgi:hypothetical protein
VLTALAFPLSPSAAKPRIWITSPSSGNALSGDVKFAVAARSAGKVKFYVDGRLLAIDRTPPYSTRLDTRRLSIGSHVLRALAVNRSGGVSDRVSVKVRNARPDATAPSASRGLVVSASTETVLAFAWAGSSDNRGVAGYDVLLDGMKKSETTALDASLSDLACGEPYTLGVRAFDAAGNRSTVSSIVAATSACGSWGRRGAEHESEHRRGWRQLVPRLLRARSRNDQHRHTEDPRRSARRALHGGAVSLPVVADGACER